MSMGRNKTENVGRLRENVSSEKGKSTESKYRFVQEEGYVGGSQTNLAGATNLKGEMAGRGTKSGILPLRWRGGNCCLNRNSC